MTWVHDPAILDLELFVNLKCEGSEKMICLVVSWRWQVKAWLESICEGDKYEDSKKKNDNTGLALMPYICWTTYTNLS